MPYESPYQSMVENEVLFQQQPWISRVPHHVRHALTPVADALTGAGAGLAAGLAAGRPGAGAVLGTVAGGLYGVLSHNPTPAQHWAFNNPEKVHVLKARAAYDAAGGDNFYHGEGMKMAAQAGATEVLRRLGLEKSATPSPERVARAVQKRIEEKGPEGADRLFERMHKPRSPLSTVLSAERTLREGTGGPVDHANARGVLAREDQWADLQGAARHGYTQGMGNRKERARQTEDVHQSINPLHDPQVSEGGGPRVGRAKLPKNPVLSFPNYPMEMGLPAEALEHVQATAKPVPLRRPDLPNPEPLSIRNKRRTPELHAPLSLGLADRNAQQANDRVRDVSHALTQTAANMDARAAKASPAAPHAPAAPKSRLGRNLALGAGALGLAAAGVAAYKGLSRKPEEAQQQGKVAMLRALGL